MKKKKCDHNTNVRIEKYFYSDGTPMIKTECCCGYVDDGCVYTDVKDWENRIIVKENGIIILNEIK